MDIPPVRHIIVKGSLKGGEAAPHQPSQHLSSPLLVDRCRDFGEMSPAIRVKLAILD
jgi:hypothetical protein